MSAIFVTGTDTGVGKTLVSRALLQHFVARGLTVSAMKPVASGAENTCSGLRNQDAEILMAAANTNFNYSQVNPYVFEPAIAPHIAANQCHTEIDIHKLNAAFEVLSGGSDCTIIEGAGGWQVPLNHTLSFADWVSSQNWPVVLVVGIRLGCINHAQLTVLDILRKKTPLLGWVANIIEPELASLDEVIQTLARLVSSPLLGTIPFLKASTEENLSQYLALDQLLPRLVSRR